MGSIPDEVKSSGIGLLKLSPTVPNIFLYESACVFARFEI